jgi:hypothetical protein
MKNMFFAERINFGRSIGIALVRDGSGDKFGVAKNITFESQPKEQIISNLMEINHAEAQHLMDQLWSCGIRPTEGQGSAGSLAATERHLKDMQTIAFKLLDSEIK